MNAGSKKGFIDLFGGAGGWSIGLEMAGFRHLGLLDIDPVACRTSVTLSCIVIAATRTAYSVDSFIAAVSMLSDSTLK